MSEEWRTVTIEGKENLWYSVSNYGNVMSHLYNHGLGRNSAGISLGSITEYHPNNKKLLKQFVVGGKNRFHLQVGLMFPKNFFEDHDYPPRSENTVYRKVTVHKLVMEAFRPMDKYPPDGLKDCWDDIPEEAKKWIEQTVTVNHIDHDQSNNYVSNLEYTTQKGNSHAALKYYGKGWFGNVKNKAKQNEDGSNTIISQLLECEFK
jgi:hypothetical protein